MPFPQHPRKHAHPPLFTARAFLDYLERTGARPTPAPRTVLLVFSPRLAERAAARWGARREAGSRRDYRLGRGARAIGLTEVRGVGAPALSVAVEELVARGARRLVSVGLAGAVDPALRVGQSILCTRALRDEGTSFHYAPAGRWAYPSPGLTASLRSALAARGVPLERGSSWTIDAPYRETVAELRSVRRRGIATVEMEASALFTIARVLGVESAALFTVSDLLDERGWTPRFAEALGPLEALLDLTRDVVRSLPEPRDASGARGARPGRARGSKAQ